MALLLSKVALQPHLCQCELATYRVHLFTATKHTKMRVGTSSLFEIGLLATLS